MRFLKHERLIAGIVVVLAIVAVAMWPESMEVDVATVERGPMQVTLDEDGETRVRDKFVVSAPVAGRLQRIELEPGDPVVRGKTVLARLTPAESPLLDPRTRGELEAPRSRPRARPSDRRAPSANARRQRSTRARTTLQPPAGADEGRRHRRATTSKRPRPRSPPARRRCAPAEFAVDARRVRAAARARAPAGADRGRPRGGRRGAGRRRRPQALARERVGRAGRRAAARDRRAGADRDRRRPPVDRCRPHPAWRAGPHRAVGRQRIRSRPASAASSRRDS